MYIGKRNQKTSRVQKIDILDSNSTAQYYTEFQSID